MENKRALSKKTRQKLYQHSEGLEPGSRKAQCYTILEYKLLENETMAERFLRDHTSRSHALRAAQILVGIKCAETRGGSERCFGTIVFEDRSEL